MSLRILVHVEVVAVVRSIASGFTRQLTSVRVRKLPKSQIAGRGTHPKKSMPLIQIIVVDPRNWKSLWWYFHVDKLTKCEYSKMKNRPSKIQQGCLNSKQEDGQEEARWNWSIDVNSLSTFLGRYHEDNLKWSVRFGDACEGFIHWDANNQVHHQERKGIGPSDASRFKMRNMDFNSEFKFKLSMSLL